MAGRTGLGVIGCGPIAQVTHVPHVPELDDRDEIAALRDLSDEVGSGHSERHSVPAGRSDTGADAR